MLAKTVEAMDFTETLYKAWASRKKTNMNLKKSHSLGGSKMHHCLWVSEDLGLVTSSWNLKCSQSRYLVSLDFDVF